MVEEGGQEGGEVERDGLKGGVQEGGRVAGYTKAEERGEVREGRERETSGEV